MQLGEFNALPAAKAQAVIRPCLGVDRWVDEVVEARPYDDLSALVAQAFASAQQLSDDELSAALARHPRIGHAPAAEQSEGASASQEAEFSRREQAGLDDAAGQDAAERLLRGNVAYEAKFEQVFLIRADDRSTSEILTEMDRRLANTEADERREVVTQLREIALRRLDQVVSP